MRYGPPASIPVPHSAMDDTPQSIKAAEPASSYLHEIKQALPAPHVPLLQCAWCGLILTGKWRNTILLHLTEEGHRPYLLPDYSHGVCSHCRDIIYAQWYQSRAAKIIERQHRREEQHTNKKPSRS